MAWTEQNTLFHVGLGFRVGFAGAQWGAPTFSLPAIFGAIPSRNRGNETSVQENSVWPCLQILVVKRKGLKLRLKSQVQIREKVPVNIFLRLNSSSKFLFHILFRFSSWN